jgi:hypothetical protein
MYYSILEKLPKIPQRLINATLSNKEIKNKLISNSYYVEPDKNKTFPRYVVADELISWINENITNDSKDIRIAVTSKKSTNSQMFPHTDREREWTLMYLLQNGGDNHRTVFYKHLNPNFVLARQMNFDYSEVVEVDSITVPLHTWTIINAQEIHSVENIPDVRVAIQVGMPNNPWI